MFSARSGESMPGGYYEFLDRVVFPMMRDTPDLVAHYAMVSTVISPSDVPVFNRVRNEELDPREVVRQKYVDTDARIRDNFHGSSSRLIVVDGRRTDADQQTVEFNRNIYRRAHEEGGEDFRVAWLGEQAGRMVHVLGDENPILIGYNDGIILNKPVGGHWAVYPSRKSLSPLAVAEVVYERGKFSRFDVYRSEPDHSKDQAGIPMVTMDFIKFWRRIAIDPQMSVDLYPES